MRKVAALGKQQDRAKSRPVLTAFHLILSS